MNAQAILTPGGIADQLGNSLSGVSLAMQRASAQRQQREQQDFNNAHLLRQEARQGENDRFSRDQSMKQMSLQEFTQRRLEQHAADKQTQDNARYGDEQKRLGAQDTEKRRQFDIGAGIMSPAGENSLGASDALAQTESVSGAPAGVFGPGPAIAPMSQDDSAAMRARAMSQARAEPRGVTFEQKRILQDDDQEGRIKRDEPKIAADNKIAEDKIKKQLYSDALGVWKPKQAAWEKEARRAKHNKEPFNTPAPEQPTPQQYGISAASGLDSAAPKGNIEDDIVHGAPSFKP